MPCALASGQRTLAHQSAAEVFHWAWSSPRTVQLETVADSYGGHTSDQGTEMGIPVFRVSSIADLLPDWISRASHQDLESCDAEDDWADGHVGMDLDVDAGLGRPHLGCFQKEVAASKT